MKFIMLGHYSIKLNVITLLRNLSISNSCFKNKKKKAHRFYWKHICIYYMLYVGIYKSISPANNIQDVFSI